MDKTRGNGHTSRTMSGNVPGRDPVAILQSLRQQLRMTLEGTGVEVEGFFAYNDTLERLVEGAPFFAIDLELLARHGGRPLGPEVLDELQRFGEGLDERLPDHWWSAVPTEPEPVGAKTREILNRPQLSNTEYAVFNHFIHRLSQRKTAPQGAQQFRDFTAFVDRRNPEYLPKDQPAQLPPCQGRLQPLV